MGHQLSSKPFVEIMDCQGSVASSSHKTHQEVKQWFVKLQRKKGDCLLGGLVPKLPNTVYPKFPELKKLQELKTIWEGWTVERQNTFTAKYGDIALLLPIEIN